MVHPDNEGRSEVIQNTLPLPADASLSSGHAAFAGFVSETECLNLEVLLEIGNANSMVRRRFA